MSDTTKIKAIDLNTESLKLYTTIAIASIAGLIAFHNSPNIEHCEWAFVTTLVLFILTAISSVTTLNYYIIAVDSEEIEVKAKIPVWLNRFAIIFFLAGLIFGGIYFTFSPLKNKIETTNKIEGVVIEGNNVSVGNNVQTSIKISKDSSGKITEIQISK